MSLEIASIPLAFLAGMLSILSPCIWPLVPVVMSSAATSGRTGPLWLAAGLALSFAVTGTLLTYLLMRAGMGADALRGVAGVLLLLIGIVLVVPGAGDRVTDSLSMLTRPFGTAAGFQSESAPAQLVVGALLGLVWLPCVGPTLGAAIGLAAVGEQMPMAFAVMASFGIGTSGLLVLAGYASGRLLARIRPGIMEGARSGKRILGGLLVLMATLVLTGWDKRLEAWGLGWLPDWAVTL